MSEPKNVMICVTRQKACERLIKTGQEVALKSGGQVHVIHVTGMGENFLGNPHEGEALDYLFQVSKQAGAEMTVKRAKNIVDTLVDFAREKDISVIVVGESPTGQNAGNFPRQLERRLPGSEFVIVPSW